MLEVMLASVIIITLILALIFLSRMAISNTLLMQQRSYATFVAQQGIEGVRQRRDSAYIDGKPTSTWDHMIGPSTLSGPTDRTEAPSADKAYSYRVNTNGDPWIENAEDSSHETWSEEGVSYTRLIFFQKTDTSVSNYLLKNPSGTIVPSTTWKEVVDSSAIRVRCVVQWEFSGDTKTVEIEELLTDSRQGF